MELKRKIYDRMLKWKQEDAGCTVLLLEGARRVEKVILLSSSESGSINLIF